MKKFLPRAILLLILLTALSTSSSVDYKAKYEDQVHANGELKKWAEDQIAIRDGHIKAQDKIISEQDKDIEIQKIKEKERLILYIPFTQIGISKDHVIGGLTVLVFKALL